MLQGHAIQVTSQDRFRLQDQQQPYWVIECNPSTFYKLPRAPIWDARYHWCNCKLVTLKQNDDECLVENSSQPLIFFVFNLVNHWHWWNIWIKCQVWVQKQANYVAYKPTNSWWHTCTWGMLTDWNMDLFSMDGKSIHLGWGPASKELNWCS